MDSIFPFIDGDQRQIGNEGTDLPLFQEYAWNYECNDFVMHNGEPLLLAGNDALRVWIYKTLKTERYRYPAYSWNYGSEFEALIGSAFTSIIQRSEAERYIREALLVNPYIVSVEQPEVLLVGDELRINVTVNTIYGEVNVDV
ncbi:DUF2634 domain-containing protein [Paenibacillus taiwanensis]|uniref:DUF2634 domain-containing protein n=1 Tax=Paenibacillus taiwanensis TaxID=401638 RepID=UPI00040FE5A4|nr:DUF2634 domain-containing protein [Paenibacillus taiwanensis]